MTHWPDKLFHGAERLLSFDNLHFRWEQINQTGLRAFVDAEMLQPDQKFVLGYPIPPFQRPLLWEVDTQQVRFIESAVLGLSLGTWVYNVARDEPTVDIPGAGQRFNIADHWVIDGQQRLHAIENFFNDRFPVFGLRWSEVDPVRQKRFLHHAQFHAYETEITNIDVLRELYDRLNFGGTPHRPEDRATRDDEAIIESAMHRAP